jgi:L-histidine N-alpha-methyltransferase
MAPLIKMSRFRMAGVRGRDRRALFARDVAEGLTASPKRLSCCYFYDQQGSALFEAICELPEYYLTRAETEILAARAEEIVDCVPRGAALFELGSGTAAKTRLVIEALLRRQGKLRYVPIDICCTVLEESSRALLRDYSALEILAVAAEYREGFSYVRAEREQPKLVLWLGSNIGNCDRTDAARFLGNLAWELTAEDRVLVGIDLRKDRAMLEAAYDDSRGVTAAFNRNLLARINRELGGRFDPTAFRHCARYDERAGRVEMFLISDRRQQVAIDELDLTVSFEENEAIHTENSYKYSLEEIDALAGEAGLAVCRQWFDDQHQFSLNLLAPVG